MNFDEAVGGLARGRPVVMYDADGREGEADIVLHASFATPGSIAMLRKDAGGLICLATDARIAEEIGLPFMTDVLANYGRLKDFTYARTAYGDSPAFSISINHVNARTGVTDNDRALTARTFAEIVAAGDGIRDAFAKNFRSPGHLHLLVGRELEVRRGHTELALELALRAGLAPAVLLCEMLGEGKALAKKEARKYAETHRMAFIEGDSI